MLSTRVRFDGLKVSGVKTPLIIIISETISYHLSRTTNTFLITVYHT